jgi:hypothetical protein
MRPDLAAMTPEALTALTNRGLVKRAQKLLDRGKGPSCEMIGTIVEGTFPDGTVTRLPPDVPLDQAPCSCGAFVVCVHRVAVVLACRGEATPAPGTWNPAALTDDRLQEVFGPAALRAARTRRARGLTVEVVPGDPPTAHLPTATVRFLGADDLGLVHCDAQDRAVSTVLAVWAFRERPAGGSVAWAAATNVDRALLGQLRRLVDDLLVQGIVHPPPTFAQRIARLRDESDTMPWVVDLLDGLTDHVDAYASRSARYTPTGWACALGELAARVHAAEHGDRQPLSALLGVGTAPRGRLDKVELQSLGVRVTGRGPWRDVEAVLVDPATTAVLTLGASVELDADTDATAVETVRLGPLTARDLATGGLLTQSATRHANRRLTLGRRRDQTQHAPHLAAWDRIGAPVRITDLPALEASWRERAPAFLRPRVTARDVHLLRIDAVHAATWDPAAQRVSVDLDAAGSTVVLSRTHHPASPGAVSALADHAHRLTWVTGTLRFADGWRMTPLAVVIGETMVSLDLAAPRAFDLPVSVGASTDRTAFHQASDVLHDLAHHGLAAGPRGEPVARLLDDLGWHDVATALREPTPDRWIRAWVALQL